MTLWIADVSNHNPGFDVARCEREGFSAVLMKASEGSSNSAGGKYQDPLFNAFAYQVRATSMIPGAYHFLRAGDGVAQAELFYARIAYHGGPAGWLCACDNEVDADLDTTMAFYRRWNELTGDHPLIMYSGYWWWQSRGWNLTSLTPYLWDSRYVSGEGYASELFESVPDVWWQPRYGGWSRATLLQYSDKATVAGMTPVDVDAFEGTIGDLRKIARIGDDMEQTDKLIVGPGKDWRTVGNVLDDLSQLRCWEIGETVPGDYSPRPGSPYARILTAADRINAGIPIVLSEADRTAITAEVTTQVTKALVTKLDLLLAQLGAAGDVLGKLNDPS